MADKYMEFTRNSYNENGVGSGQLKRYKKHGEPSATQRGFQIMEGLLHIHSFIVGD